MYSGLPPAALGVLASTIGLPHTRSDYDVVHCHFVFTPMKALKMIQRLELATVFTALVPLALAAWEVWTHSNPTVFQLVMWVGTMVFAWLLTITALVVCVKIQSVAEIFIEAVLTNVRISYSAPAGSTTQGSEVDDSPQELDPGRMLLQGSSLSSRCSDTQTSPPANALDSLPKLYSRSAIETRSETTKPYHAASIRSNI